VIHANKSQNYNEQNESYVRKLDSKLGNNKIKMIDIEVEGGTFLIENGLISHNSIKDRFTVDFEYLFFFSMQKKYFFEQQFEALKDIHSHSTTIRNKYEGYSNRTYRKEFIYDAKDYPMGRNMRTVWAINTTPNPMKHYASYPVELILTPIKAGCPKYICTKCGTPRKKLYEKDVSFESGSGKSGLTPKGKWEGMKSTGGSYDIRMGPVVNRSFHGYSDCGCGAGFKAGIVLDPFIGIGTTAIAAKQLDRDYLGIDLNPNYIEMAKERFSMKQNLQVMYGKNIKKLFRKKVKK